MSTVDSDQLSSFLGVPECDLGISTTVVAHNLSDEGNAKHVKVLNCVIRFLDTR